MFAGPAPYWCSCSHCGATKNPPGRPPWLIDDLIDTMEGFFKRHVDCPPPSAEAEAPEPARNRALGHSE